MSAKMRLRLLKSKLHRATVTDANLDYIGGITIDEDLMDAVGIVSYEMVLVADITNGTRHEIYTLSGSRGTGIICSNGAAAHLVKTGDKVIIMALADYEESELTGHQPRVVMLDEHNRPLKKQIVFDSRYCTSLRKANAHRTRGRSRFQ